MKPLLALPPNRAQSCCIGQVGHDAPPPPACVVASPGPPSPALAGREELTRSVPLPVKRPPLELLFVQNIAARCNYAVLVMCAPGGRVNARQGLDPPHRL